MNLHEYQAKKLFADYALPVARGKVAQTPEEAESAAAEIGGTKWVAKAQVHAGGRGKAGGVILADSPKEVADFARKFLGTNLVTVQTDAKGQPIHHILVEHCTDIETELYLSILVDRKIGLPVALASPAGGMDIEKVARETPDKIRRVSVDPLLGPLAFQARELGFHCGMNAAQIKQFVPLFANLMRLFIEKDVSLLEVNPLVITKTGNLLCLDAKVNLDDNALYRHKDLVALRDPLQEDARENEAAEHGLSYVALDGNIGCMVNGAGLAMATMDIIKTYGGVPANFLDVGGGATKERVSEAFKIILSDKKVKAVLVNIFGGIVRCDLIATGISDAIAELRAENGLGSGLGKELEGGLNVPIIVRLEGNRAEAGMQILQERAAGTLAKAGLAEAAMAAVRATQKGN